MNNGQPGAGGAPSASAVTLAEVTRGSVVESAHSGSVVVSEVSGQIVASAGDPERVIFFRSSAKPFQAIPLIASGAADAFGFSTAELALACSSHDATPMHQRGVARMLAKIGLDEDALRCGISPPADEQEAARIILGLKPKSQIQCECSGEHVGMLAAARHLGYSLDDYVATDHPLQQCIQSIVARVTRMPEADLVAGTDGCSIPTFGAPLRAFALAYATFASPDEARDGAIDDLISPMNRFRAAMLTHPVLIGGEQTLDTDIMRLCEGRIVAKLGAEGLLCMAVPERGLGIAISCDDGSPRGLAPAAIRVLEELGLATPVMLDKLRERHAGPVTSFAGEPVGEVRSRLRLNPG